MSLLNGSTSENENVIVKREELLINKKSLPSCHVKNVKKNMKTKWSFRALLPFAKFVDALFAPVDTAMF